jgi:methionyl-tRNA formyltransferase
VSERVVLLATDCSATRILYHALAESFADVSVLLEEPVPTRQRVRSRLRKLGVTEVAGQLLFLALVVPALRTRSSARLEQIKRDYRLRDEPIGESVVRVGSVNSDAAREALRRLDPRVVVVSGTRIISEATLAAVAAPFINVHAGITPGYRGVHGGYWALAEGKPEHAGTTVHLVDRGIDTGEVIRQVPLPVEEGDCFVTYPLLHLASALPALVDAVRAALSGRVRTVPQPAIPSRLRYHPTIWSYLVRRYRNGGT